MVYRRTGIEPPTILFPFTLYVKAAKLNLCTYANGQRNLCPNRCVDINIAIDCANENNQAVTNELVISCMSRILFPPSANRINSNRRSFCEICCIPIPVVGMNRSGVANTTQIPVVCASPHWSESGFLRLRYCVDSSSKLVNTFQRPLYCKPECMRRIPVLTQPISLPRLGSTS